MAQKLPDFVKPTHYDVLLYDFDFERFSFAGEVTIRLSLNDSG